VAILKALAVKEDQARKNLGSVDGVLGVYTQEAEERRIREAMEAGESPEAAVEPKGNEAQTAADFSVFFDDLSSDYKPLRESKPLLRLIDDDVLYVKMGLELLDDNAPDEGRSSVTGLHIDEEQKFVQFVPPQDLGQRLSFVPREAIQREDLGGGKKGAKLLRMSADRSAVMDSIEQALEKKDAWPDLHLLWERHPAVEWLTDRLLVVLGRNEAPVVALSSLSSTDCVFVFQSILSNGRGRPIFVDWFGIPVRRRQREKGEELEELLDSWDWHKELPNPGTVSESRLAMLQQLIPLAVDGAREWMGRERLRVLEETRPCMAEEHNRLEKWLAKKEAAVREKYDGKARRARRSVSPHEEDLIRREIDDGKRIFEHHAGELQRMLTPERTPYLRLAAVFCAQDR
jgi:hypothetical protein